MIIIGGKVRQITVLNLGRHFPIKQEDWPLLCCRIEHLLHPQDSLFESRVSGPIERAAQRYVGQFAGRFETGLQKIAEGLSKPRAEKRYDKPNCWNGLAG